MRILLLCKDMDCGGAQTHVLELATGLVRLGHRVCVASAGGALVSELEAKGVCHVIMPSEGRDPAALYRLRRALKRLICGGFDIVHAHTRVSATLAEGICREQNICFVTTVHAHFKMTPLLRRVCRWGQAQIAVSRDLYFYLLENSPYVSARTVFVIYNGIDTQRFSPENLSKRQEKNGATVLFLSRLDASCSSLAYALCRIAQRLYERERKISIIIGGGGSEFEAVRRFAEEVNQRLGAHVIKAVGRVDNVLEFLSQGDIFVGASRAALEAMSCGIPTVLGGDEGFLGVADGEILTRGEYSNFCCRGERTVSDGELFDAVMRLLQASERERTELGCRLREYVLATHSTEIMARKTADFYESALRSGKPCHKEKTRGGVLLCGYYGFGNMGDELMLESAVRRAEGAGSAVRVLARKNSYRCTRIKIVSRSSPPAVLSAIKDADTVVFGGGTLLQNRTSRRSLVYYAAILRYAQKSGKKVELWANGIGDIRGKHSRRAVARILCACDAVGLRDDISMSRAKELEREFGTEIRGLSREQDLAFDPLLYAQPEARDSDVFLYLGVDKRQRIAVFALMGTADKSLKRRALEYANELLKKGITPVFAVMYPKQDLAVSRRFAERLGGGLAYPLGADDVLALMRGAEVVCGMRYHALLLAHVAGTRFVGIGEDDKIKSFCAEYGGEYLGAKNNG